MPISPSSAEPRPRDPVSAILDAAREVVAERGLGALSLRVVAERAGVSVGTISYRIGDRAALLDALAQREAERAAGDCTGWGERVGRISTGDTAWLADVIDAWLQSCAGTGRTAAIVRSEMVSAAYRDAALAPLVTAITTAEWQMWQAMLADWPDPARLARRIAGYCVDERPFAILLADESAYALLRASTLRGLLRMPGVAGVSPASAWHMRLIGQLEAPARAAWDVGEAPGGARAAIAERIADRIIAKGLDAVSHRAIAQATAMPVSSVAHHFPTQRDMLLGGVEALYLRLRSEVRAATDGAADRPAGTAVVALGHEMALGALREPGFLPFAIDMRRRRAENVHAIVSRALNGSEEGDRAVAQAVVMGVIGSNLGGIGPREPGLDLAGLARWL
ncbi:TetR family transcriptional regulator [Sphingomonas sp. CJ20]